MSNVVGGTITAGGSSAVVLGTAAGLAITSDSIVSASSNQNTSYVTSSTLHVSASGSSNTTLIVISSANAEDVEQAIFQIILTVGIQLGGPLSSTVLGFDGLLALGPVVRPAGALASLAFSYAALYAEGLAVASTSSALASFLSSQWDQMNTIGIFNHVHSASSIATTLDLKFEAEATFVQSAYTAVSGLPKEQKAFLGLANLMVDNPIFHMSSEMATLATLAKATFTWKHWQSQESIEAGDSSNEMLVAQALEAEMKNERVVEWAILAEATLTAILRMSKKQVEALGILPSMKATLLELYPVFRKVPLQVAGAVTKPALQVALDMLYRRPGPGSTPGYSTMYPIEITTKPAPWPVARDDNGHYMNRLFDELDAVSGLPDGFGSLRRPRFGGPASFGGDTIPTSSWGAA